MSSARSDRPYSARFVATLLREPSWRLRRVESIEFADGVTVSRRVSVEMDPVKLGLLADELATEADFLPVPVAILPKSLLLEFDLRGANGEALRAMSRARNADISTRVLLAIVRGAGLKDPPPEVVIRLRRLVHSMPSEFDAEQRPREQFFRGLRKAEAAWVDDASSIGMFDRLLTLLTVHYIAYVEFERTNFPSLLKYRLVALGRPLDINPRRFHACAQIAIDLPDAGWAMSEHVRVAAPIATFISDLALHYFEAGSNALRRQFFEYTTVPARRRIALYWQTNSAVWDRPRYAIRLQVWPEREGFVRPARFLSYYAFGVTACGTVAEFAYGLLSAATDADAAVSMLLVLPATLAAYLVARDGDHDVRRVITKKWRTTGMWALLPLWFAGVSLIVPDKTNCTIAPDNSNYFERFRSVVEGIACSSGQGFTLWMLWGALSIAAACNLAVVHAYSIRLRRAEKLAVKYINVVLAWRMRHGAPQTRSRRRRPGTPASVDVVAREVPKPETPGSAQRGLN